ncbi:hypothetical protein NCCP2222_04270 [Sporosarcina sp. NCCP-2222]|uniref:hypothetical protein n=1 Tax=Sporosarcina sp. NCCP-2222 TaxID=2935073 RepID=UPI0020899BEB|nr:hypothetical protein [Sporosarcina sp. NCCP-2222]GKV54480.1 hypothetical protein NCCP2222_04270 [Sporosarcina sp. NCCP-2222]
MNKEETVLDQYGLEPDRIYSENIRTLLREEIDNKDAEDNDYLKTLCIMLFSIGAVEDSLLIWEAKQKNFDTSCYIDVQLLCGAEYDATLDYLLTAASEEAVETMDYLMNHEETDFASFSKGEIMNDYKRYYGIPV